MALSIYISPMAYLDDKDILRLIIHSIDNPVPPLTHSITILLS